MLAYLQWFVDNGQQTTGGIFMRSPEFASDSIYTSKDEHCVEVSVFGLLDRWAVAGQART